jgi:hypothetical protein
VLSFTCTRARPEPQASIRSVEQVDLFLAQFATSQAEFCQRFHAIDAESDSQVFLGEQSFDDVSNGLLRHNTAVPFELNQGRATVTPGSRDCADALDRRKPASAAGTLRNM